jgi:2,4-dienoyl-CoA reductase-like NADH-dependent reductase (Old Yellow Enzyme family)/thioredoxin reductase
VTATEAAGAGTPAEPGRARYPRVFEPLKIGPVEVWNRIYFPPHGLGRLEVRVPGNEAYGMPSETHAQYYAERAAGGASLIFQSMHVAPVARQATVTATPWFREALPAFARVAEVVHEQGSKMMAEVWYASFMEKYWEPLGPEAPVLSASHGQQFLTPSVRKAMSHDEIRRFVEAHAVTTRHLREAGYDGVEVHASHGVLIEHFLSPYFNRREDEYGGSVENRCRLLVEALEAVHSEIGPDMAVGIRINADELLPGGVDEAGTRAILEHLAPRGLLHFVDLDVSVEAEQLNLMTTNFFEPKLHNAGHVAAVSPAARPSMVVLATPGRVTRMSEAESFLESGAADMVGAVRGQIAEPRLVRNALEGRERRSRTCIAANHCTGGPVGFGCAINATAAKEIRWSMRSLAKAPQAMRVVVVGGGPAGLEAARIAALRGHTVTVFERRERFGGGLALWASIPGREHLATLPKWFELQLDELGVDVRLATEATEALVREVDPDVVVLASGGRYSPGGQSGYRPIPIDGWDSDVVVTADEVLANGFDFKGSVVILDEEGMHAAVGIAEIAAAAGARVELVTRNMVPAGALAGGYQMGNVLSRLRAAGVKVSPSTFIRSVGDGEVTLYETWGGPDRVVNVDTVVFATMRVPVNDLQDALEGIVEYLYTIGDALAPRSLREATYEGHRFGRVIGEPGMPRSVSDVLFEPMVAL